MSADLEIPDAAQEAFFCCSCGDPGCDRSGYQAEALPHIVAAELRRLAAKITAELAEAVVTVPADADFDHGVRDVVRELEFRANELVGE